MLIFRPPYAVLSIIILLFLPLSQHSFAQLNNNYLTYDNSNLGIKIQYPSNWQVENDTLLNSTNFLVPGSPIKYAEKLSIDVMSLEDSTVGKSLNDIINHLIDFNMHGNNALTNYQVIESNPFVLNGNSAYKLVSTYSDSKFGNVKSMLIVVLKGDKEYCILYTAEPEKYDILLPTIQKMIDSFQITK